MQQNFFDLIFNYKTLLKKWSDSSKNPLAEDP